MAIKMKPRKGDLVGANDQKQRAAKFSGKDDFKVKMLQNPKTVADNTLKTDYGLPKKTTVVAAGRGDVTTDTRFGTVNAANSGSGEALMDAKNKIKTPVAPPSGESKIEITGYRKGTSGIKMSKKKR